MLRNSVTLSALILGLSGIAGASVIVPGQTLTASALTPSGTTLASESGTLTAINPVSQATQYTVSYTVSVVADSKNTFCSGCLDFLYSFTDNGPGVNERYSAYDFTGFLTNAGYVAGTGAVPVSVDRSKDGPENGSVVGFNFTGADTIQHGDSTDTLVIETNATNFVPGTFTVQDGVAVNGIGYSPTVTPEPASLALFGTGLLGVVGVARRKFNL